MTNRIKMTVEMEVTVPQALALQAMFEYWNWCASVGSSRRVAFYVDGDGNFKPKCKVLFADKIPELTDELRDYAVAEDKNGNKVYDFDAIAWSFHAVERKSHPSTICTEAEKLRKIIGDPSQCVTMTIDNKILIQNMDNKNE